jgi:hypothetical protein
MQCYRGGRFQQFSIQGRQNPDDVVGPGRTAHDPADAVDGFEELTDDERDGFDAFDFFLSAEEFTTEVVRLVEDVLLWSVEVGKTRMKLVISSGDLRRKGRDDTRLLQVQKLSMSLELLEPRIQLFIPGRQGLKQGLLFLDFLMDGRFLECHNSAKSIGKGVRVVSRGVWRCGCDVRSVKRTRDLPLFEYRYRAGPS